mmetsp:Transcript_37961/g.125213  ORF Transcript_37961/g.125213 Transcript_37961/m.125213 type:complete len:468 (-) Transcript_37961:85-1488(-)
MRPLQLGHRGRADLARRPARRPGGEGVRRTEGRPLRDLGRQVEPLGDPRDRLKLAARLRDRDLLPLALRPRGRLLLREGDGAPHDRHRRRRGGGSAGGGIERELWRRGGVGVLGPLVPDGRERHLWRSRPCPAHDAVHRLAARRRRRIAGGPRPPRRVEGGDRAARLSVPDPLRRRGKHDRVVLRSPDPVRVEEEEERGAVTHPPVQAVHRAAALLEQLVLAAHIHVEEARGRVGHLDAPRAEASRPLPLRLEPDRRLPRLDRLADRRDRDRHLAQHRQAQLPRPVEQAGGGGRHAHPRDGLEQQLAQHAPLRRRRGVREPLDALAAEVHHDAALLGAEGDRPRLAARRLGVGEALALERLDCRRPAAPQRLVLRARRVALPRRRLARGGSVGAARRRERRRRLRLLLLAEQPVHRPDLLRGGLGLGLAARGALLVLVLVVVAAAAAAPPTVEPPHQSLRQRGEPRL